jgi:hypothetical protein
MESSIYVEASRCSIRKLQVQNKMVLFFYYTPYISGYAESLGWCALIVTSVHVMKTPHTIIQYPIPWRYCFTTTLQTYPGTQLNSPALWPVKTSIQLTKRTTAHTPQSWRYCFTTALNTYPGMQIPHPDGAHSHCYVGAGLDIWQPYVYKNLTHVVQYPNHRRNDLLLHSVHIRIGLGDIPTYRIIILHRHHRLRHHECPLYTPANQGVVSL